MKRIYSNYSDEDYKTVEAKANELGVSLSAFQRHCVSVYINGGEKKEFTGIPLSKIKEEMLEKLEKLDEGHRFYVDELFDGWKSMSRSEKAIAAKQLALYVKKNPSLYSKGDYMPGRPMLYEKLKQNNK